MSIPPGRNPYFGGSQHFRNEPYPEPPPTEKDWVFRADKPPFFGAAARAHNERKAQIERETRAKALARVKRVRERDLARKQLFQEGEKKRKSPAPPQQPTLNLKRAKQPAATRVPSVETQTVVLALTAMTELSQTQLSQQELSPTQHYSSSDVDVDTDSDSDATGTLIDLQPAVCPFCLCKPCPHKRDIDFVNKKMNNYYYTGRIWNKKTDFGANQMRRQVYRDLYIAHCENQDKHLFAKNIPVCVRATAQWIFPSREEYDTDQFDTDEECPSNAL